MADGLQKRLAITSTYEIFDLSLFLGLVLVMILSLLRHKGFRSLQTRLFRRMIAGIIILLVLDDALWLINGKAPSLSYGVTFVYYLLETLPLILWLCYLDYFIHHSLERLRKRWFYIQPLLLVFLILAASIPSGFIFTVDADGLYRRGPGIPLIMGINAAVLLYPMVMAWRRRRDLESRALAIIVTFEIIPIAGSVAQVLMYRTSVLWPSVALAAIFVFLYLESHREIRDYLTGLYNRQQIDDLVQSRISEYSRRGGFALMMIDMDGFKDINDRFGHKEGDRALVTMAKVLHDSVRSTDSVGRFGGDEFMILLEEDDPVRITPLIRRIKDHIRELNDRSSKDYRLEFSCGYIVYSPSRHRNIDDLHKYVDEAMYAEKKSKKGKKAAAD